jgi:hypothetical protein
MTEGCWTLEGGVLVSPDVTVALWVEPELGSAVAEFFDWYNLRRPHQALGWRTPNEAYLGRSMAAATLAA